MKTQEAVIGTSTYSLVGQYSNGDPYNSEISKTTSLTGYMYTSGQLTPNFHKKVKSGALLPYTNFEQMTYDCYSILGSRSRSDDDGSFWNAVPGHYINSTPLTIEEFTAGISSDAHEYLQRAAAVISSRGYDALTAIAEFASVARLFQNLLNSFLTLLSNFRRLNLKEISDLWLEGRYGWRTLVYDIISFNDTLENLSSFNRSRYTERQGGRYSSSDFFENYSSGSSSGLHVQTDKLYEYDVSVRGSITADITVDAFQFNPIVTAWELVPFSFVVDWFISVGTAIQAASFSLRVRGYTAALGYQVKLKRTIENYLVGTDSGISGSSQASSVATGIYSLRVPSSVSLRPRLHVKLDYLKGLDLLALIYQRLPRR
jgi:hypothetical protein